MTCTRLSTKSSFSSSSVGSSFDLSSNNSGVAGLSSVLDNEDPALITLLSFEIVSATKSLRYSSDSLSPTVSESPVGDTSRSSITCITSAIISDVISLTMLTASMWFFENVLLIILVRRSDISAVGSY